MDKEKDYKFIKDFTKITIAGICKKLSIDKSNVSNNKASKAKMHEVRSELDKRIQKLYEEN